MVYIPPSKNDRFITPQVNPIFEGCKKMQTQKINKADKEIIDRFMKMMLEELI
jgi:hypothetical protein